jgi:DNA-binding Lrp family transcriptional regulator
MASATEKLIVAYLQKQGGATKLELAEVCCRTVGAILKRIKALKAEKQIHIKAFVPQGHPSQVSPVYALGDGTDVAAPANTNCDTYQRRQALNKE